MESTNQLQNFIGERHIQMPQEFIDRFIENYKHKGEWQTSEKAYDGWFEFYYTTYKKFCIGIERELLLNYDYKEPGPRGAGLKRRIFISFSGLKQLEMKCDKNTRIYYNRLEDLSQEFVEYQQQISQQQLQDKNQQLMIKDQQIAQYESMKKAGVIYEIYNKNDQNENYIGCHNGIDPNDRLKTHINSAISSLKLPLYRRIFKEGLKSFNIRIIEQVNFYNENELKKREDQIIEQFDPSLNKGYLFNCICGHNQLKEQNAIMNHRESCCQYIKKH